MITRYALVIVMLALTCLPATAGRIHEAAGRGDLSTVKDLLDDDPSLLNAKDLETHAPLHYAAVTGNEEMVALLIDKGADLEIRNDRGRTPIILAAREMGGPGVIAILLDAGADIDAKDNYGATALDLAAWRGTADVVSLLIERGAGLPVEGSEARSLLANAASHGLEDLFTTMVEKGVDLRFETEAGGDLLHSAAAGGSPEIIRALVDHGLDPAGRDLNGWTPLHFAADMNHLGAVRLLVEAGTDINARTVMGQTAYNIAEEWGYVEVMETLAAMGGETGPPRFPDLEGPYLGQEPPEDEPRIFARGIVMGRFVPHSAAAFSPDGDEVLWSQMIPPRESGYGSGRTMMSKVVDGRWTYPEPAVFEGVAVEDCPFFSADGRDLYDIARRPLPGESAEGKERIWRWSRRGDSWVNPVPLDAAINDLPLHWQFSLDRGGNLYFSTRRDDAVGGGDIYCSELAGGSYQPPYNLGGTVNSEGNESTPFVDPGGGYLIFSRAGDLYISFRNPDGTWIEAESLGDTVNTSAFELCPTVSPDGRYLFYFTEGGLKWMDAGFIEDMGARIEGR